MCSSCVLFCILCAFVYSTAATSSDGRPDVAGSDRGLYNEHFVQGDIYPTVKEKNSMTDPNLRWPHGVVYVKLDENIGCPRSKRCALLRDSFAEYHARTCVRFVEWSGERDRVEIFVNSQDACWSHVGRQGGVQRVSLGAGCWHAGIVLHELAHTLGFYHEMNRPDRDDWILVYWQNILPRYVSAFERYSVRRVDTLGENFDYGSVMLYDEYAFSKDGVSPTIKARRPRTIIGPLWKKRSLSDSDVRRVRKLYGCG